MKWQALVGSLVLCAGLGTHCYGFGPLNLEPVTGDTGVPCVVKCDHADKCGKPKYWKKVSRTYTKALSADCGCSKKICKVIVTEVSYQLVLMPKLHCADDLVCSCTQPKGAEICKPCGECCYYKQKNCCSCASHEEPLPETPKP